MESVYDTEGIYDIASGRGPFTTCLMASDGMSGFYFVQHFRSKGAYIGMILVRAGW